MHPLPRLLRFLAPALLALASLHAAAPRNVLLVTLDGLRWQEVFRGADEAYLNTEFGGIPEKDVAKFKTTYLAATPEERRAKLMPFLWSEVVTRGQVIGNRDRGGDMQVANSEHFSYPGYQEVLAGFPDPLVTSNAPIPNRNVTVLEWLHNREAFAGKVAACASWHVIGPIINPGRSKIPVWVSSQNPALAAQSPRFADLDRLMRDIPIKAGDEHYDGFTYHATLEMIARRQPRVLYVSLGEPDTNAHARKYHSYLESITRCDRFIRELWDLLQSQEAYRGKTTLIVTTDHGRGRTPTDWKDHNKKTPGSSETWAAILGPQTPALGERTERTPITSAQIAATVAAAVGEDYRASVPAAAPAIPEAIK